MVQYGKGSLVTKLPGGSSLKFKSSKVFTWTYKSPMEIILADIEEPSIFKRYLFKLFGVKECAGYIESPAHLAKVVQRTLDEYNIQYQRFGIDQTDYFCFDQSAMYHMRIIQ